MDAFPLTRGERLDQQLAEDDELALCIWFDEWVDARDSSNAQREKIAAPAIAAIPTWPSWRSPFWTDSVRDHLRPLINRRSRRQRGAH